MDTLQPIGSPYSFNLREINDVVATPPPKERSLRFASKKEQVVDMSVPSSIDTLLFKYGYVVIDRVTAKKAGQEELFLIKAMSPLGFHVFVKVDRSGVVSYDREDLSMHETLKGQHLPIAPSTKRGTYMTMGDSALVCKEGVCTLTHNPHSTNPIESEYTYTSQHHTESISCGNSIVSYPLISLGEIETNHKLVLSNTCQATTANRQRSYGVCTAQIDEFITNLAVLIETFNAVSSSQKAVATKLSRAIKELSALREKFLNEPPQNEEDLSTDRVIYHNLCIKDELSSQFLDKCSQFGDLNKKMKDIIGQLDDIKSTLNNWSKHIDQLEPVPCL